MRLKLKPTMILLADIKRMEKVLTGCSTPSLSSTTGGRQGAVGRGSLIGTRNAGIIKFVLFILPNKQIKYLKVLYYFFCKVQTINKEGKINILLVS